MKFLKSVVLVLFLIAIGQSQQIAKVTFPIGKNFVQNKGSQQWKGVRYFMPLYNKDKIKTSKESRCEVTFQNKKVMRIGENSVVEITKDASGTEEVKMSRGLAWLSIFLPKGKSKIRVRTPSSVCSIRGTVYRLNCDSTQTTYRCYKGKIAVTPFEKDGKTLADSTFSIGAGEELILVKDFEEYKKQQEKAFQDFKKKDQDAFEEFLRKDQQQFDDMVKKDLAAFKQFGEIAFKRSKFDEEKDAQSDWVQWNKQRDLLLQQQ